MSKGKSTTVCATKLRSSFAQEPGQQYRYIGLFYPEKGDKKGTLAVVDVSPSYGTYALAKAALEKNKEKSLLRYYVIAKVADAFIIPEPGKMHKAMKAAKNPKVMEQNMMNEKVATEVKLKRERENMRQRIELEEELGDDVNNIRNFTKAAIKIYQQKAFIEGLSEQRQKSIDEAKVQMDLVQKHIDEQLAKHPEWASQWKEDARNYVKVINPSALSFVDKLPDYTAP